MIQQSIFTQAPHKLSSTDSLKNHLNYLEVKVDSLNKIVNETRIGTGFFSDVISQDLYMFSTIIVIAGFVSWVFVASMLAIHKKHVEKDTRKLLFDETKVIYKDIAISKNDIERALYDVARSLFLLSHDKKLCSAAVYHGVSALKNLLDLTSPNDKQDKIALWISVIELNLKGIKIGNLQFKRQTNDLITWLNDIIKKVDDNDKAKVEVIKGKILHLAYTQDVPPEDLMADKE